MNTTAKQSAIFKLSFFDNSNNFFSAKTKKFSLSAFRFPFLSLSLPHHKQNRKDYVVTTI